MAQSKAEREQEEAHAKLLERVKYYFRRQEELTQIKFPKLRRAKTIAFMKTQSAGVVKFTDGNPHAMKMRATRRAQNSRARRARRYNRA
jgi:hypothetical protein